MSRRIPLLIASPLEPEHVATLAAVDEQLDIMHEPELLGRPRFPADHSGAPFQRTPAQRERWETLLARAEIMWDFDQASMPGLLATGARLRWVQSTSAGVGQFAARHGLLASDLVITTASGVHAGPLADFALMAMLMFTKDYARLEREKQARHWERHATREMAGQTALSWAWEDRACRGDGGARLRRAHHRHRASPDSARAAEESGVRRCLARPPARGGAAGRYPGAVCAAHAGDRRDDRRGADRRPQAGRRCSSTWRAARSWTRMR